MAEIVLLGLPSNFAVQPRAIGRREHFELYGDFAGSSTGEHMLDISRISTFLFDSRTYAMNRSIVREEWQDIPIKLKILTVVYDSMQM